MVHPNKSNGSWKKATTIQDTKTFSKWKLKKCKNKNKNANVSASNGSSNTNQHNRCIIYTYASILAQVIMQVVELIQVAIIIYKNQIPQQQEQRAIEVYVTVDKL